MKSSNLILSFVWASVLFSAVSTVEAKNNYSNKYVRFEEKAKGLSVARLMPSLSTDDVPVLQPYAIPEFNSKYTPFQMSRIIGLWDNGTEAPVPAVAETAQAPVGQEVVVPVSIDEKPDRTYSAGQFVSLLEMSF